MANERQRGEGLWAGQAELPLPVPRPAKSPAWPMRVWRPAGTAVVVALAILLTWHVVKGKDGLSVWQQKRAEDQLLSKEIKELERENAHLKEHVERLKSDPGAIEFEARQKLHYTKPGEVVVELPAEPASQAQPAGAGK